MWLPTHEASVPLPRDYICSRHLVRGRPMRRACLMGLPTHEAGAPLPRYYICSRHLVRGTP